MASFTTLRASHRQDSDNVTAPRRAALAAAVAAIVGSASAGAAQIDTVTWQSNVDGYIAYAYTCQDATGGAPPPYCGGSQSAPFPNPRPLSSSATNSDPQADAAIYSYGALDTSVSSTNSTYTWTNDTGVAFRVDSIQLFANGAVGTRPYDGGGTCDPNNPPAGENCVGTAQGSGIISTWETSGQAASSLISDARVQFTNKIAGGDYVWDLGGSVKNPDFPGTPFEAFNNQLVYADPRNPAFSLDDTLTWFNQSPPNGTWQTPIDRAFDPEINGAVDVESLAIEPDESIEIRLFEENVDVTESQPEALLSNVQIIINGTTANVTSSNLDFGAVRIGDSSTKQASVQNGVGEADGFRALGVSASDPANQDPTDPAGQFTSAGGQTIGTLDFDTTANPQYTFTPDASLLGITSAASFTADVTVSSTDANTSNAGFELSAVAVAPVFSLSGTGVGAGTIDLPDATVGGAGSLVDLDLRNLFEDSYAEANLGILGIGFDTGSGLVDSLNGFSLSGLPSIPFNVSALGTEAFQILFNPTNSGYRDVDLIIRTDVGTVAGGNGTEYTYTVRGTGSGTAPAPGTAALMALMIAGLGISRRRRA